MSSRVEYCVSVFCLAVRPSGYFTVVSSCAFADLHPLGFALRKAPPSLHSGRTEAKKMLLLSELPQDLLKKVLKKYLKGCDGIGREVRREIIAICAGRRGVDLAMEVGNY